MTKDEICEFYRLYFDVKYPKFDIRFAFNYEIDTQRNTITCLAKFPRAEQFATFVFNNSELEKNPLYHLKNFERVLNDAVVRELEKYFES